ncbi:MAG: hypothetical protein K2K66_05785, partial [Ruminococcus sp.]|nr:hypothetical protein [Ruminococcus sp.]
MLYCKEFAYKLNDSFLQEYKEDTLLVKGRRFKFVNKNGVFNIEILSFDGAYVEFKFIDEGYSETWTIDNFYIIDNRHLEKLFNNAKEYDMKPPVPEWE